MPRRDALFRDAEAKEARAKFRERKNMIPRVIIRAMAASERRGNARSLSRVGEPRVALYVPGFSLALLSSSRGSRAVDRAGKRERYEN